jgi:hypothetical protein
MKFAFLFISLLIAGPSFADEICVKRPLGPLEYLRLPEKICLSKIVVDELTFKRSIIWDYEQNVAREDQQLIQSNAAFSLSLDQAPLQQVSRPVEILTNGDFAIELARSVESGTTYRAIVILEKANANQGLGPYLAEHATVTITVGETYLGYNPGLVYKALPR